MNGFTITNINYFEPMIRTFIKKLHLQNILLGFSWIFETHIFIDELQPHMDISLPLGFLIEEFLLLPFQTLIQMKMTRKKGWRRRLVVTYELHDLQ